MIYLSQILLFLSSLCYGAAFGLHLIFFSSQRLESQKFAAALMRLGFLISTVYFAAEALEHGFFLPVINFSQALAFFAWSLAFVYLVLIAGPQSESFGLILSPILLILTGLAFSARIGDLTPLRVPELLLNPYFMAHIIAAFFAYANFTISFSASILYLIQQRELKTKKAGTFYHKLPSLEELERLIYQPLLWGVPMLAAAFGIGLIWSKSAFGKFLFFDPKTIATALTLIFYFVILYRRYFSSVRGKQIAFLSMMAFGLMLCSFVGTRFIQGSHHFVR